MEELWSLLPLLVLLCFVGSFVQRITGFGFGIFVMMFLPTLLGSQTEAAALSGLLSCVTCIYNGIRCRKQIRFRLLVPVLLAAMITIPIAVSFTASAPEKLMRYLLGGALIGLSIYFLFFAEKIRLRPTVPNGILAGGLGGIMNGLFSAGGPPVVLYLVQALPDKTAYFATIQTYFALTNLYSAANRILQGIITWEIMGLFCVSVLGSLLGNYTGGKVFDRLDGNKIKKLVYMGMIVSGVLMFF